MAPLSNRPDADAKLRPRPINRGFTPHPPSRIDLLPKPWHFLAFL